MYPNQVGARASAILMTWEAHALAVLRPGKLRASSVKYQRIMSQVAHRRSIFSPKDP